MNRTGLICVLAIAVAAGLLFGLYPELDLQVARHFHAVETPDQDGFALRYYPSLVRARNFCLWIPALLVAPAAGALLIKLILPWRKLLMPGRAVVFLIATMILAPGIIANVILKEHWGRSRPVNVTQFGGNGHFVPWWDRRGDCPENCSFVSGDVAGAFWTLAPAALAPLQWRALAYVGGLCPRHGHGSAPRDVRRAFSYRCNLRRRLHLSHHLDCIRLHLSLAAHAPVG